MRYLTVMPIRFTTKLKLGAGAGSLMLLAFPVAAHASTSSSPLGSTPLTSVSSPVTQTVSGVTSTTGTSTLTAPITTALEPKAADTTPVVTVPAPGATADAYAAQVAGVVAISHTHASASGSGTSSTADPLEIGGTPPASQFGGTENGPGQKTGNLLDTGPSSQFRLALLPWGDSNSESAGQNSASAISDVVLLDLGDQTTAQSASVRVLQSTSNATWNSSQSTASSSSDGAIIKAGGPSGLDIDLLHAETNSSGSGHSYLLSINGNEIGSSDQVNGQCTLTIPGLLSLDCLTATGGTASSVLTQTAGVLGVTVGGTSGPPTVGLIQATGSSGSAGIPSVSSASGGQQSSGGGQSNTGAAESASQPAATASGPLAFTGADVLGLLLAALALGLIGITLVWTARRFRTGIA